MRRSLRTAAPFVRAAAARLLAAPIAALVAVSTAALVAAAPVASAAAETEEPSGLRLAGPTLDTWVVGHLPPEQRVSLAEFGQENRAISRIAIYERGGRLCRVHVGAERVDGSGGRRNRDLNQCGMGGERGVALRNDVTFRGNSFIYGVSVCMDASGQEVRGVGIRYVRIDKRTGRQDRSELYERYEHGDCAPGTWSQMAVCPAGHVASGLAAVFLGGGRGGGVDRSAPRALSGLMLRCQLLIE